MAVLWQFMDAAGVWQAYPPPIAREIEEMYEYGAPHCLYHPTHPLIRDGARQQDAAEGFMVGMPPPPDACTHRILFDLNVDVALYEGTLSRFAAREHPVTSAS